MNKHFACAFSLLALSGTTLAADMPANGARATPPDFAAQFKEGDTNHDGKLSYEEYKAARLLREGKVDEVKMKHYVERFNDLDMNKDKFLTFEEYKGRITREKYQPGSASAPAAK